MDQARLSNDMSQLPQGLDSIVGERGATLSGGQRQRTAIARALVRDPKVLLLDDALASVDMQTAAEILRELRQQTEGKRSRIIVTQRIATVVDADQIIVLDHGQIVERGSHESCCGSTASTPRCITGKWSRHRRRWRMSQVDPNQKTPTNRRSRGQNQRSRQPGFGPLSTAGLLPVALQRAGSLPRWC